MSKQHWQIVGKSAREELMTIYEIHGCLIPPRRQYNPVRHTAIFLQSQEGFLCIFMTVVGLCFSRARVQVVFLGALTGGSGAHARSLDTQCLGHLRDAKPASCPRCRLFLLNYVVCGMKKFLVSSSTARSFSCLRQVYCGHASRLSIRTCRC